MVQIDNRTTNATGNMPSIDFQLNEGNFTRDEDMDTDEGWKRGGHFANKARKGMEMQISTVDDMTVEPLSSGIPIGRLRSRSHGTIPTSDATMGNYQMRRGPLDLYGELDWVQLNDTHGAITPTTYLTADLSNQGRYKLSPSNAETNVVALQSRAQNETGYIMVFKKPGAPV